MKLARMKAPDGATSFVHDGEEFEVEDDGTIELPERLVELAKPHGFLLIQEQPAVVEKPKKGSKEPVVIPSDEKIDAMERPELEALCKQLRIKIPARTPNADLRELLKAKRDA